MDHFAALENALGKSAEKQLLSPQAGDVPDTTADVAELNIIDPPSQWKKTSSSLSLDIAKRTPRHDSS